MATQPSDFGFGEYETMLRDSARKYFEDNYGPDKLHTLVAHTSDIHRPNECVWNQADWHDITNLGWPAACIAEEFGGSGLPFVAAIGLAEEVGRAGFPSPLLSTLSAAFVLSRCKSDAAGAALSNIARGTSASIAFFDSNGRYANSGAEVNVTGNRLSGAAAFVQDARKADQFVVSALGKPGTGLYLVDKDAEGLTIAPNSIVDLTRDQATLSFNDVEAIEIAPPGEGQSVMEQALPALLCLVAADMVGAGEWLLQTTVDYAQTRTQFDRPLGFFQAVKHPLVNVMIAVDRAKSLTYNAACAIDHEPGKALQYAHMAKAEASDMAVTSASRAVQFHGGIGFTWECYVQLFFKRQMHNQVLFGDAKFHRNALAEQIIGKVA